MGRHRSYVSGNDLFVYHGGCTQFNESGYAVPVALGLVGDAVAVLPYADILDTVIYFY